MHQRPAKPAIVFAMKYPDSEGSIWLRVSRAYDLAGGRLAEEQHPGFIAYPQRTGKPAYTSSHLKPVELNLQDYSRENKPRIADFIRRQRVGIIVFRDVPATEVDVGLLHGLGVRTVQYVVQSFTPEFRIPLLKQWANRVRGWVGFKHHHVYIPNSGDGYEVLTRRLKYPARRIHMIKNGVDTEKFQPGARPDPASLGLPQSDHYALMVSQARPEKRVDFLIRVAAEVFRRRPELSLTFVFVGDGGERPELEALARELGVADRFRFVGRQDNVAPYYRLATVLLHAADRESFGNVTVEANATGVPVICPDLGGPREIIAHGETGYLLRLDDLEGYASALLEFIDHPDRRRAFGEAGRKRAVELFSIEREVEQLHALLREQFQLVRV